MIGFMVLDFSCCSLMAKNGWEFIFDSLSLWVMNCCDSLSSVDPLKISNSLFILLILVIFLNFGIRPVSFYFLLLLAFLLFNLAIVLRSQNISDKIFMRKLSFLIVEHLVIIFTIDCFCLLHVLFYLFFFP